MFGFLPRLEPSGKYPGICTVSDWRPRVCTVTVLVLYCDQELVRVVLLLVGKSQCVVCLLCSIKCNRAEGLGYFRQATFCLGFFHFLRCLF